MLSWTSDLFTSQEEKARRERRFDRERLELLRELKGAIQATVEYASFHLAPQKNTSESTPKKAENAAGTTATAGGAENGRGKEDREQPRVDSYELDERDHVVEDLLIWIERCLWHGLRSKRASSSSSSSSFLLSFQRSKSKSSKNGQQEQKQGEVSIWDWAREFASIGSERDDDEASRKANLNARLGATALDVEELLFVTTKTGKGRAWIRTALNAKVLDAAVYKLINEKKFKQMVDNLYEDFALIRYEETAMILASMLAALNGLDMKIHTDRKSLDTSSPPLRRPVMLVSTEADASLSSMFVRDALFRYRSPANSVDSDASTSSSSQQPSAVDSGQVEGKSYWSNALRDAMGRASNALGGTKGESTTQGVALDLAARALHNRANAKRKRREEYLVGLQKSASVFGVSLDRVCSNPMTSALALTEPRLAIPDLMVRCVAILWTMFDQGEISKDNPVSVFVPRGKVEDALIQHVLKLRTSLSQLGRSGLTIFSRVGVDVDLSVALASIATTSKAGIPVGQAELLKPEVVAGLLRLFLRQLPEPLVPFDAFEPLVMCQSIEEQSAKVRNICCLVDTFPQSNRLCLGLLLLLLHHLSNDMKSFADGLAATFAPAILRPPPQQQPDGELRVDARLSSLGGAAGVLSELIESQDEIMSSLRQQEFELRSHLAEKLARIRAVSDGLNRMVLFTSNSKSETETDQSNSSRNQACLELLWDMLYEKDQDEDVQQGNGQVDSSEEESMSLRSEGWRKRGCVSSDVSKEFRGGGETALYDLAYFVTKHGKKARMMVAANQYPFVQAACQVSRMTAGILGITSQEFMASGRSVSKSSSSAGLTMTSSTSTSSSNSSSSSTSATLSSRGGGMDYSQQELLRILEDISAKPWWAMLDEEDSTHRVFCMAFLLLDLNFTEAGATTGEFHRIAQETKFQMLDLLALEPRNVNQLWHSWIELRADRMRYKPTAGIPEMTSRAPSVAGQQASVPSTSSANTMATNSSTAQRNGVGVSGDTTTAQANSSLMIPAESDVEDIEEVGDNTVPYDQLLPKLLSKSEILKTEHIKSLEASLPDEYHGYDWALLYSSSRDGFDLSTLYQKGLQTGAWLLLVRDTNDHSLGGFSSVPCEVKGSYSGNEDTFLFTLEPGFAAYRASRKNNYFILANDDSLAFGGGGDFALYLDEDLQTGTSGECPTFSSPCLASGEDFDVKCVELWSFQVRRR